MKACFVGLSLLLCFISFSYAQTNSWEEALEKFTEHGHHVVIRTIDSHKIQGKLYAATEEKLFIYELKPDSINKEFVIPRSAEWDSINSITFFYNLEKESQAIGSVAGLIMGSSFSLMLMKLTKPDVESADINFDNACINVFIIPAILTATIVASAHQLPERKRTTIDVKSMTEKEREHFGRMMLQICKYYENQ